METKEAVCSFIAEKLREKLNSGTKIYTISFFSRKTGVGYNSIRRVVQNEVKTLSAANAFALLAYIESPELATKTMKISYEKWFKNVGKYHEASRPKVLETANIKWDDVLVGIIDLTSAHNRCSERLVIEKYGKDKGLKSLNLLLNENVVVENKMGFFEVSPSYTDTNMETLISRISADCDNFPHEEVGTTSKCARVVESLTDKGMEEVNNTISEFYSKICTIVENDKKSKELKSKLCRVNVFSYYTEEGA